MGNGIANTFGQLTAGITAIAQNVNGVLEPLATTLTNFNKIKGAAKGGVSAQVFVPSAIGGASVSIPTSFPINPPFFGGVPPVPQTKKLPPGEPGMLLGGTSPLVLAGLLVGAIFLLRKG